MEIALPLGAVEEEVRDVVSAERHSRARRGRRSARPAAARRSAAQGRAASAAFAEAANGLAAVDDDCQRAARSGVPRRADAGARRPRRHRCRGTDGDAADDLRDGLRPARRARLRGQCARLPAEAVQRRTPGSGDGPRQAATERAQRLRIRSADAAADVAVAVRRRGRSIVWW